MSESVVTPKSGGLETVRVITEILRLATERRLDVVEQRRLPLIHDKVVSPTGEYRHNDPQYSDCDRHNAHSHLQATLLKHAVSFPVAAGKLVLGQFQAIIAAELDGPRHRDLAIQIIGR